MSFAQFIGLTTGPVFFQHTNIVTGTPFTVDVPVPSNTQAGDLMILTFDVFDSGATDGTLRRNQVSVSGFTQASLVSTSQGVGGATFRKLYVFWKRLVSPDSGHYTITVSALDTNGTGNDAVITPTCLHYRNVRDSGSPFDVIDTGTGTSTSTTPAVSLSTTGTDRTLLHVANSKADPYLPPTGFTLRIHDPEGAESNTTGGLGISERLLSAAGSTGNVTAATGGASPNRAWLGAIVSRDKTVTAGTSIATGARYGTPSLQVGVVFLLPGVIATPAAPPGPTVRGKNTITVGSIESPLFVPTPTVAAGAVILGPSSVAPPAAVPTPAVRLEVRPTSIPTVEAVGEPAALAGDIVVPSIGTGQQFGTATLLPGGVSLTVASTGSAQAFGTPSVRLSVVWPSIASALAFGTATLLPGAASITAASVASALVVPPPWLQTQVLRTSAIPTAEHVNSPQLLLRIVVDDGIPNDLLIQSQPELLLGAARLFPTSIGSRESVPVTLALVLSIDPTARLTGSAVTTSAGVRYELVAMARLPQQTGAPTLLVVDAIDWLSIKWANVLNRPQELEISCLLGGLTDPVLQRLRSPAQLATELHVIRDGATVFAGPLMGGQKKGEQLTLTARGLMAYFRFMVISDQDIWWPTSSDQHLIARGMVDHCQTKPYGHFGIDTADTLASGVIRDGYWKAEELHNVADRIEDLTGTGAGFDVDVDPATRRLQMWTPRRGVDRSTGDDAVVFDARNITDDDVMFSVAPGDVASHAVGTGTTSDENDTLIAQATNPQLLATFGRATITDTWGRDAPDQATLQRFVDKLLDDRDQALWVPGPNVRVDPDSDPTRYDVGDYVWFDGGGRIGVSGKFRVRERTIEVDSAGRETGSLVFT